MKDNESPDDFETESMSPTLRAPVLEFRLTPQVATVQQSQVNVRVRTCEDIRFELLKKQTTGTKLTTSSSSSISNNSS